LHAARTAVFTELDNAGTEKPSHWPAFLQTAIDRAMDAGAQTDLAAPLLSRIGERLETLASYRPNGFVLAHGDLHLNNALVRGDEIVLFDKAASAWLAPPMFDLCLIYSEAFPGARYGVARGGDHERLAAFQSGYGPLDAEDARWIDHFVLLRSLTRYPSPFVPELGDIIEAALARAGG
jgi:Ser/Thr protein kinase RdoA (MazF antagonist)